MNFIKLKSVLFSLSIVFVFSSNLLCQTQTLGVFINDSTQVFDGYTLFAPKHATMTYLIDNKGRKIHEWSHSTYPPGQSVYLLPNGHLLRSCMTQSQLGTGGGEGGRIEEYTWDDSLVWYMNYSTPNYMQHHDIKKLPNGNIIMLVVEKKTMSEIIAAGFDTSKFQPDVAQKGFFLPDEVVEVQPTYPSGGTVVWEWHVWDHLIQHFDATKSNYGTVANHPELIDCAGDHKALPLFWNHMNSIDYNPTFDQIALSVRGNSEVWIIDHSTNTVQAAGHSGGTRGKGGDLIYRWGNPICYGAGTNQKYYQQHDVEWIKPGYPGEGHLSCFNNGVSLNYSSIDEITTPVDVNGNYALVSGSAYGPSNFTWTYTASPASSMYAGDISGAERLPNGNTIICVGPKGLLLEVTYSGNLVWKYINPSITTGPLAQGDTIPHDATHPEETLNSIFRVYKYPKTYAAFTGKTLTPGNVLELNTSAIKNINFQDIKTCVYPNPFNNTTTIEIILNQSSKIELSIYDIQGRLVKELIPSIELNAGTHQLVWDGNQNNGSPLPNGVYYYKISAADGGQFSGKITFIH